MNQKIASYQESFHYVSCRKDPLPALLKHVVTIMFTSNSRLQLKMVCAINILDYFFCKTERQRHPSTSNSIYNSYILFWFNDQVDLAKKLRINSMPPLCDLKILNNEKRS